MLAYSSAFSKKNYRCLGLFVGLFMLIPTSVLLASEKKTSFQDGIYLKSSDEAYSAHIDFRFQTRYSNIDYDVYHDRFESDEKGTQINRARFKLGGDFAFEWLKYYAEYDLVNEVMLDFWVAPKVSDALHFRIGRYKVPYNRERFDSSGKQLFVERSLVTPPFTIDRQMGVTVMGHVFEGKAYDSSYYAGVFLGNGRAEFERADGTPMTFARWQWNIFQSVLPFSRSDLKRHEKPSASLAIAAVSNRSAYTAFSSSGGGALPGYPQGLGEQYKVKQTLIEFALMYRGFSIQSEYHKKKIDDTLNHQKSTLDGFYVDGGYFFSERFDFVPEALELIARYATVHYEDGFGEPDTVEEAIGANWYFYGHRNKFTFDVTRITQKTDTRDIRDVEIRFQWDLSI